MWLKVAINAAKIAEIFVVITSGKYYGSGKPYRKTQDPGNFSSLTSWPPCLEVVSQIHELA